jgi:hypothetical protein
MIDILSADRPRSKMRPYELAGRYGAFYLRFVLSRRFKLGSAKFWVAMHDFQEHWRGSLLEDMCSGYRKSGFRGIRFEVDKKIIVFMRFYDRS